MANNGNRDPDDDLRDEAAEELRARRASLPVIPAGRYAGAVGMPRTPAGGGTLEAPPEEGTLPTTPPAAIPPTRTTVSTGPTPVGDTLGERLAAREAELKGSFTPWKQQNWKQRIGTVAQDIGTALEPQVMAAIPGTMLNRRLELANIRRELGEEQARQSTAGLQRAQTEEAQTRSAAERLTMGQPTPVPGTEGYNPQTQEPEVLWKIPGQGYQVGPMNRSFAPAPGTMPQVQQQQPAPPTGGTAAAPPMAAPTYVPGKPPEKERKLTPEEVQKGEAGFLNRYQVLNPGKPLPSEYKLPQNPSIADYDRIDKALEATERASAARTTQQGVEEQRKFNQQMRQDEAARQAQQAQERKEKAAGEWVRAVDNDNKVHYLTRGDYDQHPRDFHPNPGNLPPGAYDKATDHTTAINEMQARMNAAVESARDFDWSRGQQSIVQQAMQHVEQGYADKVIGIPIMDYVAQNLKQLGLKGANSQTRQYIIDLLSLREAMLAMPKEITGGSRSIQTAVEALYQTLPAGITPDYNWAHGQLLAVQSIIDRLHGTRVPIIDGMPQVQKVPDLYKYAQGNPKTGQMRFSDDKKNWFDENGNPLR